MDNRFHLIYWGGNKNFGDELSLYIVEKITGKSFSMQEERGFKRYPPRTLVAIGSILTRNILHKNVVIWGTGTLTRNSLCARNKIFPINRFFKDRFIAQPEIRAVRGPLTRTMILDVGLSCPSTYGDPAILLPKIYRAKMKPENKVGLVLHHTQNIDESIVKALRLEGIKLISIHREGRNRKIHR